MNTETYNILFYFLPELSLALSVLILNIISSRTPNNSTGYNIYLSASALSALFSLSQSYYLPQLLFAGSFSADHFSFAARVLISVLFFFSAIALKDKSASASVYSLLTLSAIGAMLTAAASNIFILCIAVSVTSAPLLLVSEGTIKQKLRYFILSSVFFAVMLYGSTILYGIAGSGDYQQISGYISFNPYNHLSLLVAVIMILTGLLFTALSAPVNLNFAKISGGFSHNILLNLTVINILAALFASARFIFIVLHDKNTFISENAEIIFQGDINWKLMLAILSVCSVIAGYFAVLWQYSLKKIFTFITISNAGLLLTGLIAGTYEGLSAFITGAVIFSINSAGLLYIVYLISKNYNIEKTTELKSLGGHDKLLFILFIYFMVSSAGFPLTPGFNMKLILYSLTGLENFWWLIISGILSSAVLLYFIFKLTITLFSARKTVSGGISTKIDPANSQKTGTFHKIILLFLLIWGIFASILIQPIINWAKYCSLYYGN